MLTKPNPIFILSLDMELAWGFMLYPRSEVLALLRNDPEQGRGAVNLLLDILDRHDIPATWAVVGHLFLRPGEGRRLISRGMPPFMDGWLNWDFYCGICDSSLYCGRDIIEKILARQVNHEIGLHSFFHTPFSDCSRAVAEAEVGQGTKLAKELGITLRSFAFPGDEIGHIDVLKDNGFEIYRGVKFSRGSMNQTSLLRNLKNAMGKIIAPPVEPRQKREGVWEIPSSMHFGDPQMPFTVLPRAKLGLNRAIRTGKVFHVFLHPWCLLRYDSLATELEKFLALVARKRNSGELQVMTMGGLASCLNQRAEPNRRLESKD